jgi:superoxide dismutase, Cu-Zn family
MRPRSFLYPFMIIAALLIMTGCEQTERIETRSEKSATANPGTTAAPEKTRGNHENTIHAAAELEPTAGNHASGKVEFTQVSDGVRIVAHLQGLSPGSYGFHVHEYGDCSAPDAESAGGHFNPHNTPHGGPDSPPEERHAGDLGNIEVDEDGRGFYERVDSVIELSGPDSILGRSVVVHAEEDDLTTQPAGDAGDRIACGVIRQEIR